MSKWSGEKRGLWVSWMTSARLHGDARTIDLILSGKLRDVGHVALPGGGVVRGVGAELAFESDDPERRASARLESGTEIVRGPSYQPGMPPAVC